MGPQAPKPGKGVPVLDVLENMLSTMQMARNCNLGALACCQEVLECI